MNQMDAWTADDIPDLTSRTVVVTGGNSGVGFASVVEFTRHGADTILACRSISRGETALQRVHELVPSARVRLMHLDLGDLDSINRFVDGVRGSHDALHVLLNNAGIMAAPFRTTVSGFESQFGTNHLGHFALTAKLMPWLLRAPTSRVVNVSSLAHRGETIDFNSLQFRREGYNRWRAYGRSKLANLLFTYELQRRLDRAGVSNLTSLAAHPGLSRTNISHSLGILGRLAMPIAGLFFQSAEMGALPSLRASTDLRARGGEYYGPDGRNERKGYPVVVASSPQSHDAQIAAQLWQCSEELTGAEFSV